MMDPKDYKPDKHIPDLSGKVIFITGGTAGIGKLTILALAPHNPSLIHFTGRNLKNAESVINEAKALCPSLRITFSECDHKSLASVNRTANSFLATNPGRLDMLICNAGIMGGAPELTNDGYEIQFGVNYLSHALLTKRFLPLLASTEKQFGDARIVNLTSAGYALHPGGIPFSDLKTSQENIGMFGQWRRYCQSKFAIAIYTAELAKRYPTVTAVAIHPGVVYTDLVEGLPFWDRWFVKVTSGRSIAMEEGAHNTCWAATATRADGLESGSVYYPVGVLMKHTQAAADEDLWKRLWEWTQKELESWV